MNKSSIGFMVWCGFFAFALNLHAQRVGNFEITAQPVNKEVSRTTSQGINWTDKQKNQSMVYKVRIDHKGIDALENVTIQYIVAANNSSSMIEGSEKFEKVSSQQKIEFETKGVENTYMQYNYGGTSYKSGKAQLRGIAIRILQGDKLLAEWSQPGDIKNLWKK
jgi:hypothetical protein